LKKSKEIKTGFTNSEPN